jgi:hypothetical protein
MFHWDRMYKHEENIERDITERVEEYVCEFFDVETIFDLTDSDIDQLESFVNNDLNEYSVMQVGFKNIINDWELNLDEEDEWDD